MAQKATVQLVDDLDGTVATAISTVIFGPYRPATGA